MQGKHEAAILVIFLLALAVPQIGVAFLVIAMAYLARRITPFESREMTAAWALVLQPLPILLAGVVTIFFGFSQPILLSVILIATLASFFIKKRPLSSDPVARRHLLLLIPLTVAVFFLPNFAPGNIDEHGLFTPFIYTSDSWYHQAVSQEIANGIIPPDNPHLAGYQLAYYWGAHLYMASASTLLGVPVSLGFRIIPLLVIASIAAAAYLLVRQIAPKVALTGTLIGLLAGPLAAYFLGVGGKLLAFPYVVFLSEFQPQTLGLALFFTALAFYLHAFEKTGKSALKAALPALAFTVPLAFVNTTQFIVLSALMLLYWVARDFQVKLNFGYARYAAVLASLAATALLLPVNVLAAVIPLAIGMTILLWKSEIKLNFSGKLFVIPLVCISIAVLVNLPLLIRMSPGSESGGAADIGENKYQDSLYVLTGTASAIIGFSGFPIVLVLLFLPWLCRNLDRKEVWIPSLFFGFAFIVAMIGKLPLITGDSLPVGIFMLLRRFLNLAPLFLGIIAAIILQEKVKQRWLRTAFIVAAIIPTVAGGLLMTFGNQPYGPGPQYVSPSELAAFDWINANTPADSVFVIRPMLLLGEPVTLGTGGVKLTTNHPLPTFTGRKVLLGSDVYSSLLNPEADRQEIIGLLSAIEAVYNGTQDPSMLAAAGANYLYYGPLEHEKWPDAVFSLPVVYNNSDVTIYQLR